MFHEYREIHPRFLTQIYSNLLGSAPKNGLKQAECFSDHIRTSMTSLTDYELLCDTYFLVVFRFG